MTRAKTATQSWRTCSVVGCTNPWASNFGRRLCSACALAERTGRTLPLRLTKPAARPFSEPTEPDEEYVHDDTVSR